MLLTPGWLAQSMVEAFADGRTWAQANTTGTTHVGLQELGRDTQAKGIVRRAFRFVAIGGRAWQRAPEIGGGRCGNDALEFIPNELRGACVVSPSRSAPPALEVVGSQTRHASHSQPTLADARSSDTEVPDLTV